MYPYIKRLLDLVVASVALVIFSPLFAVVIPLLRFTAEGEVWYRQLRVGYKNRLFRIWKFATMLKDSPNMGTGSLTLRNDPRVTPLGRDLRKWKINELPQLLNVLDGSMSLVGPRPQVEQDFRAYPPSIRAKIYNVKPGITGIGSIIFRDEEKLLSQPAVEDPRAFYANYIAPYKGTLELWYQRKASLLTDLGLLFLTLWVIPFPESELPYVLFPDLPRRPKILEKALSSRLNLNPTVKDHRS